MLDRLVGQLVIARVSRGAAEAVGFASRTEFLRTIGVSYDDNRALRFGLGSADMSIRRTQRESAQSKGDFMFIAIAAVLVIAWLLGITAFHVAGGLIHLLLIVALISVVIHFLTGRRAV